MDPDTDARLPSSGPQRRPRTNRTSLNIPVSGSTSSTTLVASPSTPVVGRTTGNVRGSPYARPTPSPKGALPAGSEEDGGEGAAGGTGASNLFASLFRGALGSIGWGEASSPSKKDVSTPSRTKTVDQGDAFANIGRSPAPAPSSSSSTNRAPSAGRLTTSRSLSHLAPAPRTSASFAPSPLRGSTTNTNSGERGGGAAYPPSAWPGASQPVGTGRRSRSRGASRDVSPALTNVSAHVAVRRQPSVGGSSARGGAGGLYQSRQMQGGGQRPMSMVALSTGSGAGGGGMSEFGAGGGAGSASFHVPNFSPFAAPAHYRAGSVSASSRGGTPVRRAGSLVPGYSSGGGMGAPSPLGPTSRAGSVAGESVGTVFTSGGTPLRRGSRRSLNLSSTAVRRTPSLGGPGPNNYLSIGGDRGGGPRRSEGEAILEDYMKSVEGEEDIERMSVAGGSRAGTPLAPSHLQIGQGSRRSNSRGVHAPTPGLGGDRNRSVAPSPSPGPGARAGSFLPPRLYSGTPSRGGSPVVGQKRRMESVQGEAWERMSSLSIEPSRKKQVIFNEQEGRYMTIEQMRALQPRRAVPRNTADRMLNEIEGVRTPLGDAQILARRSLLTGMPLPAHVAVPEPRANISSAKAAANRMLPPSLPHRVGNQPSGAAASKPIGPYARRQALNLRIAKRLADQPGSVEGKELSLREQVEAIRAKDGLGPSARTVEKEKEKSDDEMEEEEAAPVEAEAEAEQKKEDKGKATQTVREPSADAEMGGVSAEPESSGSRRTLRPRKAKGSTEPAQTAAPAAEKEKEKKDKAVKVSAPAAPVPAEKAEPTPEAPKAVTSSAPAPAAESTFKVPAAPLKPKPAKSDAFQVITDPSARAGSSTSSLRQRTEKKFRQHGKSSTGRFGIDDEDDDEDGNGEGVDEVTAEELEKISVPKILFPSGFKFGGGGAAASAPAPAPAKTAPLFGTPSTTSSAAAAAPKAPAVAVPALPMPSDLKPATSLFDRLGEKAPASSSDASVSPKKVVTFAEPISSVTTFQTGTSSSGSSVSPAPTPAPISAPAPASFQFKAPTSGTSLFGAAPKAPTPAAPNNFFSMPAAAASTSTPASSETAGKKPEGGVPNFFGSSLKKLDADKPAATAAASPAPSTSTGVPNFFASALSQPAASENQSASSTTKPSIPNFFGSSLNKTTEASASAPAPAPASGFSSGATALKGFGGFGAPAASTSAPAAAASTPAPLKFGGFGTTPAATASNNASSAGANAAPAPPKFSFGTLAPASTAASSAAPATTPAPAASTSSIFGSMPAASTPSATPSTPTSLFGAGSASKKRGADDDAGGSGRDTSTGESSAKKPFGGFNFGSTIPATPPASSTAAGSASSLFGQQQQTAPKAAPPVFSFGKSAPAATPAAAGPAPAAPSFGGFGSSNTTGTGAANGNAGGNSMDTGSPPKTTGGFGFGGANTGATGGSTSMFGSNSSNVFNNNGSATTPTSMSFGQSQPAPASGGFTFGSKPAAPAGNMFGSSMNGGGTTTATPAPSFGMGSSSAQPGAPAQNGFGSSSGGLGMTLNKTPNFNFGASSTPSAGGAGVFTFGSNTPTQSTTPTLAPASAPFAFGAGSAAASAPSSTNSMFAFGANNAASQGGMGMGGNIASFPFGGGAGPGAAPGSAGSGSAGPASPFFGQATPQASAGLGAPPAGGPVFSLGAAPSGGGSGGVAGGTRPMRRLPKRK
ncbi:hypothetical protein CF319_g2177 [Tilletia indica]|uniref:Uncharacterized protein n=1 Tax=Tilletia indica TaxID=43049 RepID=A0A177TUA7_9BASI|nr:hypothetical protein CF319_g2177 [Tilletia indica]KAE8258474.1 hypothetical protein A4X13_0g1662 [Tilletia indica]